MTEALLVSEKSLLSSFPLNPVRAAVKAVADVSLCSYLPFVLSFLLVPRSLSKQGDANNDVLASSMLIVVYLELGTNYKHRCFDRTGMSHMVNMLTQSLFPQASAVRRFPLYSFLRCQFSSI